MNPNVALGNVPRVDGQLAMARAFSDERLKEHITAEPDIFVETIDANTDFIILASDGVWKVRSQGFWFLLSFLQSLASTLVVEAVALLVFFSAFNLHQLYIIAF